MSREADIEAELSEFDPDAAVQATTEADGSRIVVEVNGETYRLSIGPGRSVLMNYLLKLTGGPRRPALDRGGEALPRWRGNAQDRAGAALGRVANEDRAGGVAGLDAVRAAVAAIAGLAPARIHCCLLWRAMVKPGRAFTCSVAHLSRDIVHFLDNTPDICLRN
jgi:hypothetical protein